jgi:hypothetical protein
MKNLFYELSDKLNERQNIYTECLKMLYDSIKFTMTDPKIKVE